MVKRLAGALGVLLIVAAAAVIWLGMTAYADDSLKSAHYQIDESFIGGSGLIQSNSSNYQLGGSSAGDTATGNSSSTNYQTNAGYNTTNDPALSFTVNNSSANFGSFSASGATVATSTFEVSNYTSYGYVVQIIGDPPTNGNHTLSAMNTTGPSQAGTEQFGINLVANTSPVSVGANPDNGQFGYGTASTNYNTPNNYRYVSGETIASAPKTSGITTYTISYLVNVSGLTPGGKYTSDQVLICTGTF